MLIPRVPNERELTELTAYLMARGQEREDVEGFIAQAAIACFDGYTSDGSGYHGTVMVVVWSGGPDIIESYTFDLTGFIQRVHPKTEGDRRVH